MSKHIKIILAFVFLSIVLPYYFTFTIYGHIEFGASLAFMSFVGVCLSYFAGVFIWFA